MKGTSNKAIYAALFGNLAIAISKLIATIFTGSTAMLAETFHSFSDTSNQLLLLLGIKTSKKAASERHPFGYGKDRFFWSFIVATMLFGISGILSFQHGIGDLIDIHGKRTIENVTLSYLILLISACFEGYALSIALKFFKEAIRRQHKKITLGNLFKEFQDSKDPALITVMVEDSAALLGIAIAGIGIFISDLTKNTVYDSISSLAIGCVLMGFAFFLAKENRALLIGEAISKSEYNKILKVVKKIPEVKRIISLRTMHFSPDDVLIAMEVSLIDGLDTDMIGFVIDNIEAHIKKTIPYVNPSKIYIEIERDNSK